MKGSPCRQKNPYAPNLGENTPSDAQLDPFPWWAKAIRQEVQRGEDRGRIVGDENTQCICER